MELPEPQLPQESRPFPVWLMRAASGLIWTLVFAVVATITAALLDWLLESVMPKAAFARQALALAGGAVLAGSVLPRPPGIKRPEGIGLAWSRRGLLGALLGVAMGMAMAGASEGALWIAGALRFERSAVDVGAFGIDPLPGVPVAVLVLIVGAVAEELLVRGYALQQLGRAFTPVGAVAATGLFFGFLHAENPSAEVLSVVNTCLFGILFGMSVVRFRSLWPAVGMHLGWNLALAILGANISGLRIGLTALRAVPVGPDLWTGGEYGPEAGLVSTLVVAGAFFVIWKAPIPADDSPLVWDDSSLSKGGTEDS